MRVRLLVLTKRLVRDRAEIQQFLQCHREVQTYACSADEICRCTKGHFVTKCRIAGELVHLVPPEGTNQNQTSIPKQRQTYDVKADLKKNDQSIQWFT